MPSNLFSRRMRLAGFALAGAVLASAVGFAQPAAKPAAVAGKYEGWAHGGSQGDMAMTATLAQDAGTLSGTMNAGSYAFTIYDGKVEGNKLSWTFSDGQIAGSVTADYKDGAVNGSWNAAGESGSIELKRLAKQ